MKLNKIPIASERIDVSYSLLRLKPAFRTVDYYCFPIFKRSKTENFQFSKKRPQGNHVKLGET